MKSTPERVEALRAAIKGLNNSYDITKPILRKMLSECEQELPKPLVFDPSGQRSTTNEYLGYFNRTLSDEDCTAIRAALTKAFPP